MGRAVRAAALDPAILEASYEFDEAVAWLGISKRKLEIALRDHPLCFRAGWRAVFSVDHLHALDDILPRDRGRGPHLSNALFSRKLAGEVVVEVPQASLSRVYVVRSGDFVKIGTTQDFRSRILQLRAANPHPISVLAVFPGDANVERELHQRFAAHRHRYEWFRIEGAVADYVAALAVGTA